MPNRYASFEASASRYEECEDVKIHRIFLPSHKSGMLDQIKSFIFFYKEAKKIVKGENFDVVFATSSRLFTGFLGAQIATALGDTSSASSYASTARSIENDIPENYKKILENKNKNILKPNYSSEDKKYDFFSGLIFGEYKYIDIIENQDYLN